MFQFKVSSILKHFRRIVYIPPDICMLLAPSAYICRPYHSPAPCTHYSQHITVVVRVEPRLRVSQNRVLGPWRVEMTRGCRKLHNEDLQNLYPSPNIIRMVKSKGMRLAGYVARMGRKGMLIGH
jgi:hypothetical protein